MAVGSHHVIAVAQQLVSIAIMFDGRVSLVTMSHEEILR